MAAKVLRPMNAPRKRVLDFIDMERDKIYCENLIFHSLVFLTKLF